LLTLEGGRGRRESSPRVGLLRRRCSTSTSGGSLRSGDTSRPPTPAGNRPRRRGRSASVGPSGTTPSIPARARCKRSTTLLRCSGSFGWPLQRQNRSASSRPAPLPFDGDQLLPNVSRAIRSRLLAPTRNSCYLPRDGFRRALDERRRTPPRHCQGLRLYQLRRILVPLAHVSHSTGTPPSAAPSSGATLH